MAARRDHHPGQPGPDRRRGRPAARRLGRQAARRRRGRTTRSAAYPPSRSPTCAGRRARTRPRAGRGRAPPGAAHLHLGHHRRAQGRDARPRQPRGHDRHGARCARGRSRRPLPADPAALPRQRHRRQHPHPARSPAPAWSSRSRFNPHTFFETVEKERPTFFSAVPTIYSMLAALPDDVRPDTISVRFAVCGAAPASAELLARFEDRFGFPLIEGYGLSEATCGSTINPVGGPRKAGTVGLPFPGQELRILGADGDRVPPGENGEVVVRGANVMRGYLGRPDDTAAVIVDGWLHTGDLGHLDEDGYLTLVGRSKEMIIRGGENIYPKEIEDVLAGHPTVLEVAVIGRARREVGRGRRRLRPGRARARRSTSTHSRSRCREQLSGYKQHVSGNRAPDHRPHDRRRPDGQDPQDPLDAGRTQRVLHVGRLTRRRPEAPALVLEPHRRSRARLDAGRGRPGSMSMSACSTARSGRPGGSVLSPPTPTTPTTSRGLTGSSPSSCHSPTLIPHLELPDP